MRLDGPIPLLAGVLGLMLAANAYRQQPVAVGFAFGPEVLGGMLGGALVTAVLLALMMANAGGAWDDAKKYIEAGHFGGKGSAAHHASIVGDTVGHSIKDTVGPSLNILIELMTIVALAIVPLL